MKRIFSFVLSALLVVAFTTAHAQQNIFIWKGGNISVKSVANIDSITTSVGSWLFDIHTSAPTSVTTNTLEASISVSYADNVQSLSQTLEVGVCFSSRKATPAYTDERKRLGTSVRSYDFTLSDLDPGTTYYYRGYVKLGDEVFYGNVKSITTFGEKPSSYHIYYMVGELTGWDASNKDFAFYPESNTVHSYTAQFTGAAGLKIWMKDDFGNWDTAYGAIFAGDDSESGPLTQSGAGTIVCPEPGAYYTLTVDFANMSYEWTKVADQNPTTYYNVSLIGGFNSWTDDYDLTQVIPHNWHTVFTLQSATELKFRANHDWQVNWGDGGDINKKEYGKGSIICGGNINCPAGTYDVFFNDITGEYLFVVK